MNKRILIGCVLATAAACGGNNDDNNANSSMNNVATNNTATNNTATNNTATNNTATNNTATNNTVTNNTATNNTSTNNTSTNNSTNNMTVSNPYDLMGDCRILNYDQNGDGTVDATQVQEGGEASDYEYFTAFVTDFGLDGVDSAARNTWDADGNQLTNDGDNDGDGTYERHVEWTYDAMGNVLTTTVTDDGVDVFTIVATYTAGGNLLRWDRDGVLDDMGAVVTAADGAPDYTDLRTYDGENLLTLTLDDPADGTAEMVQTNTYDANGNVTRSERDGIYLIGGGGLVSAADGTMDLISNFTYDANNMLATADYDGDVANGMAFEQSDGTPDRYERGFTYDANGNATYFEMDGRPHAQGEWTSVPSNGTFDSATFTYDANDNQTSVTVDEGMDASDDYVVNTTYDASDRVTMVTRDGILNNSNEILEAANGTTTWLETITWQADEKPLTQSTDVDNDGTAELVAEWAYDANEDITMFRVDGELDLFELVTAADGTWDREVSITYDAMGRQTNFTDLDGGTTVIADYEYGMCSEFL